MSETKYTPGPWRLDNYPTASGYTIWGGGTAYRRGPRVLAIVRDQSSAPAGESLCNACLIAAAPELLAACKVALHGGGTIAEAAEKCRAAIAKAEGQT